MALTHKVLHHGGVVMGGGGQAEQLLSTGDRGVVDGLDVDAVSLQQGVTHHGVELGVAHLWWHREQHTVAFNWRKVKGPILCYTTRCECDKPFFYF